MTKQVLFDNKLKEIEKLQETLDLDIRKINDFIKIETTLIKISLINIITYSESNSCLTIYLNNGTNITFDVDMYAEQKLTNAFENICKVLDFN